MSLPPSSGRRAPPCLSLNRALDRASCSAEADAPLRTVPTVTTITAATVAATHTAIALATTMASAAAITATFAAARSAADSRKRPNSTTSPQVAAPRKVLRGEDGDRKLPGVYEPETAAPAPHELERVVAAGFDLDVLTKQTLQENQCCICHSTLSIHTMYYCSSCKEHLVCAPSTVLSPALNPFASPRPRLLTG
jgi:hypothetical protein